MWGSVGLGCGVLLWYSVWLWCGAVVCCCVVFGVLYGVV